MTPDEHYQKAETLAAVVQAKVNSGVTLRNGVLTELKMLVNLAQVHATLATVRVDPAVRQVFTGLEGGTS